MDAQVLALGVAERQALDVRRGIGLQQPVVGRLVEADDEHAERVVERLGLVGPFLRGLGEPLAHVGGGDLVDALGAELGDQALDAMGAVVAPGAGSMNGLWPASQDSK